MKLAVMQPCYLPWRGYFALMKCADRFVFLDDAYFPHGRSFQNRVGIKTAVGKQWLTVPVQRGANVRIKDVLIAGDAWRLKHIRTLRQHFPRAFAVVDDLLDRPWSHLSSLCISLIERIATHLGIWQRMEPIVSSSLQVPTSGWRRILDLCRFYGAKIYITGHGGRNYLDHTAFEDAGVAVMYLNYDLTPYLQPCGAFDPYVTILDLLEHTITPSDCIGAELVPWRAFVRQHAEEHDTVSAAPTGEMRQ